MNEIVQIEPEKALAVFTAKNGLDPYLAQIRAELDQFAPDISSKKGREAIASMAYKVAKSKTFLDGVGKDLADAQKEIPKQIDAERKRVRDLLDAWKDEVRKPLTDWEQAEADRVKSLHQRLQAITDRTVNIDGLAAEDIGRIIDAVAAIEVGADWQEFLELAKNAKANVLMTLGGALVTRKKFEDDQAELERLRREEAARAQAEREAKIAKEAAEAAEKAAEQRAQSEREEVARRERQIAAEAAERERLVAVAAAERERLAAAEAAEREQALRDAAQKAKREQIAAEQRAAQAVEDERSRIAQDAALAAAETKRRETNKAHKTAINRAAVAAFVSGGMADEAAKLAVTLLAQRAIPSCKIEY